MLKEIGRKMHRMQFHIQKSDRQRQRMYTCPLKSIEGNKEDSAEKKKKKINNRCMCLFDLRRK
jgi:hypothetical protein